MKRAIVVVVTALALGTLTGRFGDVAAVPQEATLTVPPVQQGGYLNSYISLLRSDLRAKKTGIISEGLLLTDKESTVFWPIYKRYELDLAKINDARLQLIKDYTTNYHQMSDAKAKELLDRSFALEERRVNLYRAYSKQFEKVLPGKRVVKFFQLEHRINMLVDIKIASGVPIIE